MKTTANHPKEGSQPSTMTNILRTGAVFKDKMAFKKAMIKHAALSAYQSKMKISNKTKFTAICNHRVKDMREVNKCPFRLFAKGDAGGSFTIISWLPNHTCALHDVTERD